MDSRREFTRQLLAELQPASPGEDRATQPAPPGLKGEAAAPVVLVAADTGSWQPGPVVRESMSLCRFGYPVGLLADAPLVESLRRQLPPGGLCMKEAPSPGGGPDLVRAVVAASSPGLLAQVALGLWEGPVAATVLWALWQGLPVLMDLHCAEQPPEGVACQNLELAALYAGYVGKLRAMGVRQAARGEILPALRQLLQPGPAYSPPAAPGDRERPLYAERVFITQRDVQRYTGDGHWQLPPGAVVTAAAKDEAARRKIALLK